MKKVLLTLGLVSTILLSACEKEQLAQPESAATLKADKAILCHQCGGGWDINDPEPEPALRTASTESTTTAPDTAATPVRKAKPSKKK